MTTGVTSRVLSRDNQAVIIVKYVPSSPSPAYLANSIESHRINSISGKKRQTSRRDGFDRRRRPSNISAQVRFGSVSFPGWKRCRQAKWEKNLTSFRRFYNSERQKKWPRSEEKDSRRSIIPPFVGKAPQNTLPTTQRETTNCRQIMSSASYYILNKKKHLRVPSRSEEANRSPESGRVFESWQSQREWGRLGGLRRAATSSSSHCRRDVTLGVSSIDDKQR